MPAYRYYLEEPFTKNTLLLTDKEHRHLQTVMRQSVHDPVEVINGMGQLAKGTITQIEKKQTHIEIEELIEEKKTHALRILQANCQPAHLEWIAEKGTELGMSDLILFSTEKSPNKNRNIKLDRLKAKMIAAMKQSARLFLPTIQEIKCLNDYPFKEDLLTYGDVDKKTPLLFSVLEKEKDLKALTFACGPEGGFTDKEIEALKNAGFLPVSLHSNTLRAETAPLCFLSLAHHLMALRRKSSLVN